MKTTGRFASALLGWTFLGAGLGSALVMQLRPGEWREVPAPSPSTAAAWIPEAPPQAAQAGADPTGAWVSTILARPLFEQQRRPPAPPSMASVAEEQPAAQREVPRLTGVLTGSFGRIAIFANPEGGRPLVVAEGERANGHLVRSLGAEEATLLGPDGVARVARTGFGDPETAGRIAIALSPSGSAASRTGAAEGIPPSSSGGPGGGGSGGMAAIPTAGTTPAADRGNDAPEDVPPPPIVAPTPSPAQSDTAAAAALAAAEPLARPAALAAPVVPVKAAEAPPPPPLAGAPVAQATVRMLVRRGDELFRLGDISAARQFYARAAAAGSGQAAAAMGRTYDPAVLARLGAPGGLADPAAAEHWRKRAAGLGEGGSREQVASR